jgi:hypothetical protein
VLDVGAVGGTADDRAVPGPLAGLLDAREDHAPVGMRDVGEEDPMSLVLPVLSDRAAELGT